MTSISENLYQRFSATTASWQFAPSIRSLAETTFTGDYLLPLVKDFLASLDHRSLMLRADGGVAPLPLSYAGFTFVPDLEVREYEKKLLAVEVKFLRDTDPSGSLVKAIGQAVIYRALAFEFTYMLVIDCRVSAVSEWAGHHIGPLELPPHTGVTVFGLHGDTVQEIYRRC